MRQLTINGTSWMTFQEVMENREPFKTYGNLSGENQWRPSYGMLPAGYREEYLSRGNFIDYVVYSYSTPIAWHDSERGWIMPEVRYSVTTSKAQGRIVPGIAKIGGAKWNSVRH